MGQDWLETERVAWISLKKLHHLKSFVNPIVYEAFLCL